MDGLPPWEVLHSETVLDNAWLRVRRQRVRTAHGYEMPEYFLLDVPNIVVLLALNEKNEVILVRQYRHGAARTVLELPAGLVEETDRSPTAAAERELLEETGYSPGRLEMLGQILPSPARQSNVSNCFLALDCRYTGAPGGDASESIELHLFSLDEVRAAARRGELASQTSLGCLFLGIERLRELGIDP